MSHTMKGDNMIRHSLWEEGRRKKEESSALERETDILIIGGGITGLTIAYFLKDCGKRVLLLDKGEVGGGVTAKTTAKITYLQKTIYQELKERFNKETAKQYYHSQKAAIKLLTNIVEKEKIACDLTETDSVIFCFEESNIEKIKKEEALLREWKEEIEPIMHEQIKYGIKGKNTYTFHPLKYLDSLTKIVKKKVNIAENVLVTQIKEEDGYLVETSKGQVKSKTIVVACHYPFFLIPIMIPLKTYIKREYVNAARVKEPKNYMAINIDSSLHSLRYYKDYLIYVSLDHKLTSRINYQKNYEESKKQFKNFFHETPEYTWMNQDIMSHDGLPFIGKIKENLFLATAYNAWGMTNGTLAAKLISDEIRGHISFYHQLFDPKRNNLTLMINSFVGSFAYLKVYAQALWKKNLPVYITQTGVRYGLYQDQDGTVHKIKLVCPHMKCSLVFNKEEKTWDCPCHGSRFDLDGNIIEGPAKEDLSKTTYKKEEDDHNNCEEDQNE